MRGGPGKWEAQALVRHENGQRQMLLPIFSHSFFLHPPLMPVTPRLPPVPPPLHPNASWRWFFFVLSTCHPPPPSHPIVSRRWCFSTFRHVTHHHHLPRIQTRAGGGFLDSFTMSPTTTTSLASKREPEVVFSTLSPHLPPPPRPNTSWRWCFQCFRHISHHHHLPRVQTRAGGGVFLTLHHVSTHHLLPRVQT